MGVLCALACSVMHNGTCHHTEMPHGVPQECSEDGLVWTAAMQSCWSSSINITIWKWEEIHWLWEASRKLVCLVSRLALMQKSIRERKVQYPVKRKGNSVSVDLPFLLTWFAGGVKAAQQGGGWWFLISCFYHWDIFPLYLSPPSIPNAWIWCFSHFLLKHWCKRCGKPKVLIWSNSHWELIEYNIFSFQAFGCYITSPNLQSFSYYVTPLWLYPVINVGLITLSSECWCKGVTAADCAPINDTFPSVWRANYCVPHLIKKSCSKKREY